MLRLVLFLGLIITFLSCDSSKADPEHSENQVMDDTGFYETTFSNEPELMVNDFTWSFIERETANKDLQTDVGLLFDWYGEADTVKFFTSRGKWSVLQTENNGILNFPKNCITAAECKEESCFWAVRLLQSKKYEVLFGGIENNEAYAVLNYGFIDLSGEDISYDVGDPEEVETYTQYGNQLF